MPSVCPDSILGKFIHLCIEQFTAVKILAPYCFILTYYVCDNTAVMTTGDITDVMMTGAMYTDDLMNGATYTDVMMTGAGPVLMYCDHAGLGDVTIPCYEDWMWTLSLLSRHATVMTIGVLPSACLDSIIGTKQLTFGLFLIVSYHDPTLLYSGCDGLMFGYAYKPVLVYDVLMLPYWTWTSQP